MLSVCIGGNNKYDLPNFYSSLPVKDTSELSLIDFCALAKSPLERKRAGKSRGPADALRTVCWYRYLASETPGISAYALGKLVEPSAYKVDAGDKSRIHMHSNKWIRYARGTVTPQNALVASVDEKYPGSAALINHPMWLLLDRQFSSLGQLARVKTCFAPQVQLEIDVVRSPAQWTSPNFAILYARKLVLLEPFNALGAIAYLLWQAKLRADTFAQAGWVRCAYSAMLVHGADLRSLGIALPMFELLKQHLLCAVEHDGTRLDYPSRYYLPSVDLLGNFYISRRLKHPHSRREFLYDACTAKHGQAPAVITWPIPVWVGKCSSAENRQAFEVDQRIFMWALSVLSTEEPMTEMSSDILIDSFPLLLDGDSNSRDIY